MIKYKLISISLMLVAQLFVWFQGYAAPHISWMKHPIIPYILALPTTFLFIQSIQYGYKGFGTIWEIKIISFIVGTVIFMILAKFIAGESLTLKNGISIILCGAIVLVQAFVK